MKIALVQQSATIDREANRAKGLEALKEAARKGAQIVCFSELAFDPFFPQEKAPTNILDLAETIPGPTTEAFSSLANQLNIFVILNLFEKDGDFTYDSSPVIDAKGNLLGKTRMVHIPDYESFHERSYYVPGNLGAPVYDTEIGKIGISICYDRHYPEYMRALALNGAEVVFIPQAGAVDEWPDDLFEAELRVTSFHNGFYTALCNRVGKELKLEFAGESFVCDPEGRVIARAGKRKEEILLCDIDLNIVKKSHARKLFLPDRRPGLYADWLSKHG